MERRTNNIFKYIEWKLIFAYLFLVLVGWISIYAAVYDGEHSNIWDFSCRYGKQMIWIAASLVIALFVLVTDPKFFSQTSYLAYAVCIIMLMIVLVVGSNTKGARSWLGIGDFGIQPSEFAKIGTALALAKFLSAINVDMNNWQTKLTAIGIVFLPMTMVLLQNDTGSALVFLSFIFVLFREGLSSYVLILGAGAIVLFVLALLLNPYILIISLAIIALISYLIIHRRNRKAKFIYFFGIFVFCSLVVLGVEFGYNEVLESHQKDRIEVLLGKKQDYKGVGYNVNQSKIAIGSGGMFGKGFLQGTQTKFNFVPEQDTDFIFCTIGEEWGFVGSAIIVFMFVWLCVKIIKVAERQRSNFARIYGYGIAGIIFFHFFVNIGMTIGLLPVIGIPLPFISYGGSSLWSFTLMLFIFIRQDASRGELM
ncbi:MAG: rod shape-determining protein RodA [Synergistales bacterium]|nr:rod shape-determining protein RodA [Bacteroidales bacterium]MDY6435439.1 rod shape-determining protein RodA [Synergistales bacterium]